MKQKKRLNQRTKAILASFNSKWLNQKVFSIKALLLFLKIMLTIKGNKGDSESFIVS
jgi:hypothetical protein